MRRSPTQTFSFWGLVRNSENVCTNRPLQTAVFSFLSDYCLPERSSMQEFGFRFAGGLCFLFSAPCLQDNTLVMIKCTNSFFGPRWPQKASQCTQMKPGLLQDVALLRAPSLSEHPWGSLEPLLHHVRQHYIMTGKQEDANPHSKTRFLSRVATILLVRGHEGIAKKRSETMAGTPFQSSTT